MDASGKHRITIRFNVVLGLFVCYWVLGGVLFNHDKIKITGFEEFFSQHPVGATIFILMFFAGFLWFAARISEHFWNNFISDVFRLRNIDFQEGLAISLILLILFGGF